MQLLHFLKFICFNGGGGGGGLVEEVVVVTVLMVEGEVVAMQLLHFLKFICFKKKSFFYCTVRCVFTTPCVYRCL